MSICGKQEGDLDEGQGKGREVEKRGASCHQAKVVPYASRLDGVGGGREWQEAGQRLRKRWTGAEGGNRRIWGGGERWRDNRSGTSLYAGWDGLSQMAPQGSFFH